MRRNSFPRRHGVRVERKETAQRHDEERRQAEGNREDLKQSVAGQGLPPGNSRTGYGSRIRNARRRGVSRSAGHSGNRRARADRCGIRRGISARGTVQRAFFKQFSAGRTAEFPVQTNPAIRTDRRILGNGLRAPRTEFFTVQTVAALGTVDVIIFCRMSANFTCSHKSPPLFFRIYFRTPKGRKFRFPYNRGDCKSRDKERAEQKHRFELRH